jgi:hypothetical protein
LHGGIAVAVGLVSLGFLPGCNLVGPIGMLASRATPHYIEAEYKGLAGQTVGVMVWPDRGVRTDNPFLQLDVAAGVQKKLGEVQTAVKPDELKDTTFPLRADSLVRYQEDHPELAELSVEDMAARFNVSRMIYIEVTDFSTRSEASSELYRGTIIGNVKVIEISNDGKAKVAYEEDDIRAIYPKDSPKEGLPDGNDTKIYQGTLDLFTTAMTFRFFKHEADEEK